MKFIYLVCACTLVFASACNEQPAAEGSTHTETVKVVEVEAEKEKSTEIKVNPNSGSIKTEGLEIEINK